MTKAVAIYTKFAIVILNYVNSVNEIDRSNMREKDHALNFGHRT